MPLIPWGNPRGSGAGDGSVNGDPTLERIARGNGLALCAAGPWIARFAPDLERIVGREHGTGRRQRGGRMRASRRRPRRRPAARDACAG